MPKFNVGDSIILEGRRATVVWLSENPSEIEPMDEYIVEFDDKHRRFMISGQLHPEEAQPINDGEGDRNCCDRQTN